MNTYKKINPTEADLKNSKRDITYIYSEKKSVIVWSYFQISYCWAYFQRKYLPECIFLCFVRWSCRINVFPHSSHSYLLSSWWTLRWSLRQNGDKFTSIPLFKISKFIVINITINGNFLNIICMANLMQNTRKCFSQISGNNV